MNRTAAFRSFSSLPNCDKVRSQNYARLFKIAHFWKMMGPSSILNLIVDVGVSTQDPCQCIMKKRPRFQTVAAVMGGVTAVVYEVGRTAEGDRQVGWRMALYLRGKDQRWHE
jgi:hypothetical protein